MGNRAVITWGDINDRNSIGIYVHRNGGIESVQAFLDFCNVAGVREPGFDCYGLARLCQVIGNYFGGSLSVGIDTLANLDTGNTNNGVYVCKEWKVAKRYMYSYELEEIAEIPIRTFNKKYYEGVLQGVIDTNIAIFDRSTEQTLKAEFEECFSANYDPLTDIPGLKPF